MAILYRAVLAPKPDGGYLPQFADFDEAFTEGDALEEALLNAAEVLMLDGRIDEGRPSPALSQVPTPSPRARPRGPTGPRHPRGSPPLRRACPCAGHLLARRQAAGRSHESTTLKQLERTAAAFGKRVVLISE